MYVYFCVRCPFNYQHRRPYSQMKERALYSKAGTPVAAARPAWAWRRTPRDLFGLTEALWTPWLRDPRAMSARHCFSRFLHIQSVLERFKATQNSHIDIVWLESSLALNPSSLELFLLQLDVLVLQRLAGRHFHPGNTALGFQEASRTASLML